METLLELCFRFLYFLTFLALCSSLSNPRNALIVWTSDAEADQPSPPVRVAQLHILSSVSLTGRAPVVH